MENSLVIESSQFCYSRRSVAGRAFCSQHARFFLFAPFANAHHQGRTLYRARTHIFFSSSSARRSSSAWVASPLFFRLSLREKTPLLICFFLSLERERESPTAKSCSFHFVILLPPSPLHLLLRCRTIKWACESFPHSTKYNLLIYTKTFFIFH